MGWPRLGGAAYTVPTGSGKPGPGQRPRGQVLTWHLPRQPLAIWSGAFREHADGQSEREGGPPTLLAAMWPSAGHRTNPGLAHARALAGAPGLRAHWAGPGMPDQGSQSRLDPTAPPQSSSGDSMTPRPLPDLHIGGKLSSLSSGGLLPHPPAPCPRSLGPGWEESRRESEGQPWHRPSPGVCCWAGCSKSSALVRESPRGSQGPPSEVEPCYPVPGATVGQGADRRSDGVGAPSAWTPRGLGVYWLLVCVCVYVFALAFVRWEACHMYVSSLACQPMGTHRLKTQ